MICPSIEDKIKGVALEMGFDQFGITKPDSLEAGESHLQKWIDAGRHGEMKYLENFSARRKNFFEQFGDAKSVIVLGVNYYSTEVASSPAAPRNDDKDKAIPDETTKNTVIARSVATKQSQLGRIARYAQGLDYHEVIARKHQELIARLQETLTLDFKAKSCVDIQPIPERYAAVQAGLGFVGKHTGLLNSKFGPWLFLSEIVTDLDLREDLPASGNCGTCNHCQSACPTGALDQDYNIDARLCIAYLTIEHKGVIPRELRPKIKDWVFGCDACLDVCPFGSKSKETNWKELRPESGKGPNLDFDELFEIKSNSEYEKRFKGTAILRANRKQMLRNACIVLGNSKSEAALPYLEKALAHEAPLVRLHAAWAVGQISHARANSLLQSSLLKEEDEAVRSEIQTALNSIQH
jgi:epoxyqueuosine reductase